MKKNKFFSLPIEGQSTSLSTAPSMGNFVSKYLAAHYLKIANLEKDLKNLPVKEEFYFLQSDNSFNAFSFIPWVVKQKKVKHLLCATYSINKRVINALIELHREGFIDKITLLVSDTMLKRNQVVSDLLAAQAKQYPNLNVLFAWVHAKITLLETNEDKFVIEGSGNWSENAYYEQYLFANSSGLYHFREKLFTDVEIRYRAEKGVNIKTS